LFLAAALAVAALAPLLGEDVAAQSGQPVQGPAGNGWSSLVNLPTGTSASFSHTARAIQSSGDWAAYINTYCACGHGGFMQRDIHLKQVLTGQQVDISGSEGGTRDTGDPASIEEARFANPYVLWYQPGPGNVLARQYKPGQYACTLCYYNVATGKGGPITDLLPSLQIPEYKDGDAMPLALDPTGTGNALIAVTKVQPDTFVEPASAQIFLANLGTGELKDIPLATPAKYIGGIGAAATINGDVITWAQVSQDNVTGMYLYDAKTEQVIQPQVLAGVNGYDLHSNGKSLFYSATSSDLYNYDLATGQITTIPDIQAYSYAVYGDLIANTPPENGRIIIRNLHDNSVAADMTVITPEAASDSLNVAVDVSLTEDMLVFSAVGVGGPDRLYANHVGISWLGTPNQQFDKIWARADLPVAQGKANRSWLWGPGPSYTGWEPFAGLPGDKRQVRYYDKSRMEVNNPDANPNDPFYVTNGLLVAEMIGGKISLGESEVRATTACTLTVVGDPRKDNPLTPSYAALRGVASIQGDNTSNDRTGLFVGDAIDVNGSVSQESTNARTAKYVTYLPQTGHNIPDLFWTYLKGMKAQYGYDWTYTMGYPITEAYWTRMRVGGTDYSVLIQAYQRRVMTYTPAFPAEWRVQQGNVGQHYFEWRYLLTDIGDSSGSSK
jgi:hypothetical protein